MTARKTAITCISAAGLALCLPAVKKSEGYWPTVKVDVVGTGQPATGGYGETEDVKLGETHDEKYWSDRLKVRLTEEYDREIGACIHVDAPDSVRAAALTTSYNVGTGAMCRGPMVAKINAGDFKGACESLLTKNAKGEYDGWYISARHKILPGLIKRRRDDQKMCLEYLSPQKPTPAPIAPPKYITTDCGIPGMIACTPKPKPKPHVHPKPKPVERPWYWWMLK